MTLLNICNVNMKLKLPSSASPCLNPNGTDMWAKGKTNNSCRTYRALNSCGIGNLSHICIRIFLRRRDVSHHDLDHSVKDHCSSPYVFISPTEATKAPALWYPWCVVYETECLLVLFLMTNFYSHKYWVQISSVI
jgi:hypothetical protein